MHILLIDTCTERGVVAYGNHQNLLFAKELPFGLNQSKWLMPYLQELFCLFGHPPPLDAIGVGVGPGSYTGIRIGVAAAQALSFAWKIPLIGTSSLLGFIPSQSQHPFAAILDARIGGVYFQKGCFQEGAIYFESQPQVVPMDQVARHLQGISHLVTPAANALQGKFREYYPDFEWVWEERAPSIPFLMKEIEKKFLAREGEESKPLELLYLRKTEAERNIEAKETDS